MPSEGYFFVNRFTESIYFILCITVFMEFFGKQSYFRLSLKLLRIPRIDKIIEFCSFLDDSKYIF